MKKRYVILPALAMILVGCRKTDESFEPGKYNSSSFDANYYLEWNGLKAKDKDGKDTNQMSFEIGDTESFKPIYATQNVTNFDDPLNGEEVHNLIKEEDKFSYGYLSKLYDGKMKCDGIHQTMLRVQLNKTGYGTFFPKEFVTSDSFAFALRGATTIDYASDAERIKSVSICATFSFYVRRENTNIYDRYQMVFDNLQIQSDNHGNTTYVSVFTDMNRLRGADAMSFEFTLNNPSTQYAKWDVTDDYTVKEKEHFAVMMYEVLFPHSQWY